MKLDNTSNTYNNRSKTLFVRKNTWDMHTTWLLTKSTQRWSQRPKRIYGAVNRKRPRQTHAWSRAGVSRSSCWTLSVKGKSKSINRIWRHLTKCKILLDEVSLLISCSGWKARKASLNWLGTRMLTRLHWLSTLFREAHFYLTKIKLMCVQAALYKFVLTTCPVTPPNVNEL